MHGAPRALRLLHLALIAVLVALLGVGGWRIGADMAQRDAARADAHR